MKEKDYVLIDSPDICRTGELPDEFLCVLRKAVLRNLLKDGAIGEDLYQHCVQEQDTYSDYDL